MRVIAPIVSLLLFILAWAIVPVPTEAEELREYFFIFELYPANYMWEGEEKTFNGRIWLWRPNSLKYDDVGIVPEEPWKLWINVTIELREFGVKHKVILRRYLELAREEDYKLYFNYTGQASTQHELYVEIRYGAIIGGEGMIGIVHERKPPIRFYVRPVYRNILYIKLAPSLAVAVVAGVVTELVRRARKSKVEEIT